jgi:hypothetical protein
VLIRGVSPGGWVKATIVKSAQPLNVHPSWPSHSFREEAG